MTINTIKASNREGAKSGVCFSDFHNVPPQGFLRTFFLAFRPYNKETKSHKFAFVVISVRLAHIMTVLEVLISCKWLLVLLPQYFIAVTQLFQLLAKHIV